jgi:hypothetical protein
VIDAPVTHSLDSKTALWQLAAAKAAIVTATQAAEPTVNSSQAQTVLMKPCLCYAAATDIHASS